MAVGLLDCRHRPAAAQTIRRTSIGAGGEPSAPLRLAEAQLTDATILARSGDVEGALTVGETALQGERRSPPSLLMVGRELADTLAKVDAAKRADDRAQLAELAATDAAGD